MKTMAHAVMTFFAGCLACKVKERTFKVLVVGKAENK